MALIPQFTQAQIKARVDNFIKVIEKRQIQRLQYLGEQCVRNARLNGDYMDQTGNLRSSVGYILFKNGIALHQSFEQIGSGSKGTNQGRSVAIKAGSKYNEGICLVVVAGMNYALHVEAKGRDVLTSTELFAKQEMPKILAELKNNINSALE
jgi:hypothetical protein